MHVGVVVFFVSWKGYFARLLNADMWKMVMSCIMQCLLRERNYRSFEDRKRTVAEVKDIFFMTLYYWTSAFDLNISSFHVFIVFSCFFFLVHFLCTRLHLFAHFNKLRFTCQKFFFVERNCSEKVLGNETIDTTS